ncbi:MAG TPA: hypothetical protein VME18_12155 [Acidobacteriaceae bacterium]|nr:hypothetical protein [Acidobacteriaceae bacterium]
MKTPPDSCLLIGESSRSASIGFTCAERRARSRETSAASKSTTATKLM